jgi:uncharacterized protein GlcG (DUF336 family)
MRKLICVLLMAGFPGSAQSQGQGTLDAKSAQAIVAGCVAQSASRMQSHAIAVVDLGGHLVAALRMDGNGSGIFDFALAKAEASAAWGFTTAQMETSAKATPGFANAPKVVTVPGGVPIYSADGKTRLGAIGVSGEAPVDDAACAEAGVRSAGLRTRS